MIRKVCPICEQTMTMSHYCKFCRQFVKTPYIRDITYYLNESHPADEKECTYHGVGGGLTESRNSSAGSKKSKERKKGRNGVLVWMIVLIVMLFRIGEPVIRGIVRILYWIVWRGFQRP